MGERNVVQQAGKGCLLRARHTYTKSRCGPLSSNLNWRSGDHKCTRMLPLAIPPVPRAVSCFLTLHFAMLRGAACSLTCKMGRKAEKNEEEGKTPVLAPHDMMIGVRCVACSFWDKRRQAQNDAGPSQGSS